MISCAECGEACVHLGVMAYIPWSTCDRSIVEHP